MSAPDDLTSSIRPSGWVEPHSALMLRPSGSTRDQLELGPERAEDRRRGPVGRAVGAVERDPHAGQIELERAAQLADVVVEGALQQAHAADSLARSPRPGSSSIAASVSSSSLMPRESKNLIPLSAKGLWEAETTPAEVEAQPAGQHGCGGRREDAAEHRVPASRRHPGGERLLEHRPRLAGVADDQDLRALGLGLQRRGAAQPHGQIRREQFADRSADPVGPEEFSLRHLGRTLTLGELRLLAGLLEPCLAALLDPGVAGEHAPALELRAQRRVHVAPARGRCRAGRPPPGPRRRRRGRGSRTSTLPS